MNPYLINRVKQELAESDCAKFAQTILNQLAPGKGRNLVDVFNGFLTQSKPHDLLTRVKPQGCWGEACVIGSIKDSTATVWARRVDVNQTKADADNIVAGFSIWLEWTVYTPTNNSQMPRAYDAPIGFEPQNPAPTQQQRLSQEDCGPEDRLDLRRSRRSRGDLNPGEVNYNYTRQSGKEEEAEGRPCSVSQRLVLAETLMKEISNTSLHDD